MASDRQTLPSTGLSLDQITLNTPDASARKSKVVATLGPSCWSTEMLGVLIDSGVNVARLNFSHGDHETHGATLERLREAVSQRENCHVAVLLDTKGPEIRTGFLANHDKVQLRRNQSLELVTDYEVLGDETKLACSYPSLPTSVEVGSTILAADGSLVMTVTEIREASVVCRVENDVLLGERKNMNLPGCIVDLPTLTEKDEDDILNFGIPEGVDFIAASFTRKASDIEYIRSLLGPRGDVIKIIAKIENQEGLDNYDEILAASDGIMVARGDLGMEIHPSQVFLAQKAMIRKANIAGKPVITATQMLESMVRSIRPTRAECSDVANAVLDGTDAVMLSGETANGDYPQAAVEMMCRVCCEAEAALDYNAIFNATRNTVLANQGVMSIPEAIASSAVKTSIDMAAKMLVVLTETGTTARLVAKYRPAQPVLVLTASHETARQCEGLLKGCHCRVLGSMLGTERVLHAAADIGKELGWVGAGDRLVAIHGMREATSGATNQLKVLEVPE